MQADAESVDGASIITFFYPHRLDGFEYFFIAGVAGLLRKARKVGDEVFQLDESDMQRVTIRVALFEQLADRLHIQPMQSLFFHDFRFPSQFKLLMGYLFHRVAIP